MREDLNLIGIHLVPSTSQRVIYDRRNRLLDVVVEGDALELCIIVKEAQSKGE